MYRSIGSGHHKDLYMKDHLGPGKIYLPLTMQLDLQSHPFHCYLKQVIIIRKLLLE